VRALLRRRPSAPAATVGYADVTVDPATRDVWRAGRRLVLTPLEFDLLHWLVRHPRQVFARQQLLDAVWGGGSAATSNVVDVYIGYLRAKLEAEGGGRLVHTVRGVGYALRDTP